jgi:hypothetical protein
MRCKEFKSIRNSEECKTCITKQPNDMNVNNHSELRGILPYSCHVHFYNIVVLSLSVQSSTYPLSPQIIR